MTTNSHAGNGPVDRVVRGEVIDAANALRDLVIAETIGYRGAPRSPKIGVLDALEPLIIAIAELQVATRRDIKRR